MELSNDTSHSFKRIDASSYDCVTKEFDRFTEQLSSPLADRLVSLAQLKSPERVLDVGTGTGIVAFGAARKVAPEGEVLGIDLSDGMLAAAETKAVERGLKDHVKFRKMDAERLAIEDNSYDVALSLFALLHFPDPLSALREMFRVLRPGGRIVLAVGSGAPLFSLVGIAHRFRRLPDLLLTIRGRQLLAPDFLNGMVERYFPANDAPEESPLAHSGLNRTRSVPSLIRQSGFIDVRTYWQGHRPVLETPEEFWDMQRTFSSLARKRLAKAPDEKVGALREEFLKSCREVQSLGGKLVYPVAALYVIARRP